MLNIERNIKKLEIMRNEDYLAKIHSDYSHLSGVEKQRIAYEQSKERVGKKKS